MVETPKARIAHELVDCITSGRDPTAREVIDMAEHIWSDARGQRSAFSWGDLATDSSDRLLCLRAAQAALNGSG